MSKEDETGGSKAARPKRRLISQAPPPIEPIQGRANIAPRSNTEPSPEAQRKIIEARDEFNQAAYNCQHAIEKGRSIGRIDQKRWTYESQRWTEVLRPAVEYRPNKV
jgi:hypothetical protein